MNPFPLRRGGASWAKAENAGLAVKEVAEAVKGADIVMIAGILNTMNYQFIVDKNVQRPDQLKGKALAVSRYGSSSSGA